MILFNADWDPLGSGPIRLGRPVVARDGTARLGVRVPGPGVLRLADGTQAARGASATTARTRGWIASVRRTVRRGGKVTLKVSPTRKGRGILRRNRKLTVRARITFRRTGSGRAATATKRITLRLPRK
jgi:hypothetical protein